VKTYLSKIRLLFTAGSCVYADIHGAIPTSRLIFDHFCVRLHRFLVVETESFETDPFRTAKLGDDNAKHVASAVDMLGCDSDFVFFYERQLENRILRGRTLALALEQATVDLLNGKKPLPWINVHTKLRDCLTSESLTNKFHSHLFDIHDTSEMTNVVVPMGLQLDASFSIITAHAWSTQVGKSFRLPPQVQAVCDEFTSFYTRTYIGKRTLQWAKHAGNAILQSTADGRLLVAPPLLASVLLLFNDACVLSLAEIAALLDTSIAEVTLVSF